MIKTIETSAPTSQKVTAANLYLLNRCNMRCKFCFSTFKDNVEGLFMRVEDAKNILRQLSVNGIEKVTFVGGETTLYPHLTELLEYAKECGMTTMIVTNGSRINEEWFDQNESFLDWITLSVDSINSDTNVKSGRSVMGKPISEVTYREVIQSIHKRNFRLKINTVVSAYNYLEDLSSYIVYSMPERWKIFQVLHVEGQNDNFYEEYYISNEEFQVFISTHKHINKKVNMVVENNDLMTGSYLMIDPNGRLFDNTKGVHTYSQKIIEVGFNKAYSEIMVDNKKFISRNGFYNWV
jgi:radical S-adenosyl methionine domain-containing protein 2